MKKSNFGKGSRKRRMAAQKAARTRKRNAALGKKQKKVKSPRISTIGKYSRNIAAFVKDHLIEKIIADLKHLLISNEGDLQSSVYYHLREFLKGNKELRLSSELTIRPKRTTSDIFIDITISKIILTHKLMQPIVAIELKEHPGLEERDAKKDIKKLQMLRKRKIIKYGFLIYVCRSPYDENELQEEANSWVSYNFKSRIIPIIINIYDHLTGTETIKFDKRWEQTKRYELSKATAKKAARTRKRNIRKKRRRR